MAMKIAGANILNQKLKVTKSKNIYFNFTCVCLSFWLTPHFSKKWKFLLLFCSLQVPGLMFQPAGESGWAVSFFIPAFPLMLTFSQPESNHVTPTVSTLQYSQSLSCAFPCFPDLLTVLTIKDPHTPNQVPSYRDTYLAKF